MVLTDRERGDLHSGVIEYLAAHDFSETLVAFRNELQMRQGRFQDKETALERRWATLRKLTSANQQLESQVTVLNQQLIDMSDPIKRAQNAKLSNMLPTDVCHFSLSGHRDCVTGVAFHAYDSIAFSTSEVGSLRTWDLDTRSQRAVTSFPEAALCIAIEPPGAATQLVAVGCGDGTCRLFESENARVTLHGHNDAVTALQWVGDSSQSLVTASRDGEVKVWDAPRARVVGSFATAMWVRCLAISGVSGHAFVAIGGNEEFIQIWQLLEKKMVKTLAGHANVQCLCFTPAVAEDALIDRFGTEEQRTKKQSENPHECSSFLISGGRDKNIVVWNVATATAIQTLSIHQNWIRCLSVTSNGKHVVSSGDDGKICVTDILTGRCTKTIVAHNHFVTAFALHPTGRPLMLTGSADKTLKLWLCA